MTAGYSNVDRYYTTQSDPTLSGNATDANVLSGKTFYSNSYTKHTGSIVNWGLVSPVLGLGQSYILEKGYYEGGEIYVIPGQAKSPTEITVGTAITPDTGYGLSSVTIPSNATITVGEENKLNIIVPTTSSSTVTYNSAFNGGGNATALRATVGGASLNSLEIKDEATAAVTIFSGSLYISRISGIVRSEDLISSNIRRGVSILGAVGTYAASSTAFDIYKAQYAGNVSSG